MGAVSDADDRTKRRATSTDASRSSETDGGGRSWKKGSDWSESDRDSICPSFQGSADDQDLQVSVRKDRFDLEVRRSEGTVIPLIEFSMEHTFTPCSSRSVWSVRGALHRTTWTTSADFHGKPSSSEGPEGAWPRSLPTSAIDGFSSAASSLSPIEFSVVSEPIRQRSEHRFHEDTQHNHTLSPGRISSNSKRNTATLWVLALFPTVPRKSFRAIRNSRPRTRFSHFSFSTHYCNCITLRCSEIPVPIKLVLSRTRRLGRRRNTVKLDTLHGFPVGTQRANIQTNSDLERQSEQPRRDRNALTSGFFGRFRRSERFFSCCIWQSRRKLKECGIHWNRNNQMRETEKIGEKWGWKDEGHVQKKTIGKIKENDFHWKCTEMCVVIQFTAPPESSTVLSALPSVSPSYSFSSACLEEAVDS